MLWPVSCRLPGVFWCFEVLKLRRNSFLNSDTIYKLLVAVNVNVLYTAHYWYYVSATHEPKNGALFNRGLKTAVRLIIMYRESMLQLRSIHGWVTNPFGEA